MIIRPRRNRNSPAIRNMVRETQVGTADLIYPLFVKPGNEDKEAIRSMPGVYRHSEEGILREIDEAAQVGIQAFMLFPAVPESLKDTTASYSYDPDNFYLYTARKIKQEFPDVCLISDVAMDPYSSDGHDGIVKDGVILNDETLEILGKMSVAQAHAGFDLIGPSDMMDGRVEYIRKALDDQRFTSTGIMAYTAKYASAFYGPFRDALDSSPKWGDKKTYQMDPANRREALIEANLDVREGADYIMVKPALHYLDIIRDLRNNFQLPVVSYHVSGEYSMLMAAAEQNYVNLDQALHETLLALKRAGSDLIITYFAKKYAITLSHSL
ncbi:MAG TPA: porphobilinogen synthase [Membranihabitans sp.]|nr:porphobilinogen synthase [Membranihabitans sp.]